MKKQSPEYRLDVTVKNNLILEKMEAAGIKNVAELARQSGVSPMNIGNLLNLKVSPFHKVSSKKPEAVWTESAKKIAATLGCIPEELFPEEAAVLRNNTASAKVRAETIWSALEYQKESARTLLPETVFAASELQEKLDKILGGLTQIEEKVLRARFFDDKTLEEVGKERGVSRERIRQIEAKALRKLRHPSRSGLLLEAGADDGNVLLALSAQ